LVQVMPHRSGVDPLQFDVQAEPEQTGIGAVHVTPQVPQLPFCPRFAAQPPPASAQSAKPVAHV
jgi:hypothetical protein